MILKVFSSKFLDELTADAVNSPRRRQHWNIHEDYSESVQRLFNAVEPDSYIRPHRHGIVPRVESMIAIRGLMMLFTFDDEGNVVDMVPFGVSCERRDVAAVVEIPPGRWHTVIALEPGSVMLELKAGPFDPEHPKEMALWAPEDGSREVADYLQGLFRMVDGYEGVQNSEV